VSSTGFDDRKTFPSPASSGICARISFAEAVFFDFASDKPPDDRDEDDEEEEEEEDDEEEEEEPRCLGSFGRMVLTVLRSKGTPEGFLRYSLRESSRFSRGTGKAVSRSLQERSGSV